MGEKRVARRRGGQNPSRADFRRSWTVAHSNVGRIAHKTLIKLAFAFVACVSEPQGQPHHPLTPLCGSLPDTWKAQRMGFAPFPNFDDPPFACPPDIVLDLPAPVSVNRIRKIDWVGHRRGKAWRREADADFLLQKRSLSPAITGRFEIIITLRDGSQIDADNTAKIIIDSVRRYRLITDDSPKYMRRVVIQFGDVAGCRVTVRGMA